jgi:hypothetical protein
VPGSPEPVSGGEHGRPPAVHRVEQHDMGHLIIIY